MKNNLKNSLFIPKSLSFLNQIEDKLTAASLRDIEDRKKGREVK